MNYAGPISSSQIEEALDREEMVLYYQPQCSLISGEITGIEALVRWHSKTLGDVNTGHFIKVLENSELRLIAKFDQWLLRSAFKQILAWRQVGVFVPVYLNFSTRYLEQTDCLHLIEDLMAEYGINPEWFGIEVTESCAIRDMTAIGFVLDSLQEKGVKIALDDFCTSYCSLEYLSNLPANKIKIDRQFIRELNSATPRKQNTVSTILESLIDMAYKLGIEVVAEGVETQKQLEVLTLLGCDSYQGYLFCHPIPATLMTAGFFKELNPSSYNAVKRFVYPDSYSQAIAA
jgi:EAL domain-containing protein (putative c-di-GMP-specific phosphodiesterase class I)